MSEAPKKGSYGVSPMPSEPPAGWKAPTQEEFSKPTVEGTEELDAEAEVGRGLKRVTGFREASDGD